MSLFPIFKVNKMSDKNVIDTIYVFYGSRFSEEIDDPNDLFEDDPGNKEFIDIFNKEELFFANQQALNMVGLDSNYIFPNTQMSILNFIDDDYHDILELRIKKLFEGETTTPIEIKIKQKDGTTLFVESQSTLVDYYGKKAIQTI